MLAFRVLFGHDFNPCLRPLIEGASDSCGPPLLGGGCGRAAAVFARVWGAPHQRLANTMIDTNLDETTALARRGDVQVISLSCASALGRRHITTIRTPSEDAHLASPVTRERACGNDQCLNQAPKAASPNGRGSFRPVLKSCPAKEQREHLGNLSPFLHGSDRSAPFSPFPPKSPSLSFGMRGR